MKTLKAIKLALSKLGYKELTGNNDGPFIDEIMTLCGLDNQKQIKSTGKGHAWCSAFVSWVMINAGVNFKNAWAPAWFPANKLVNDGKYRPMDVCAIDYKNIDNGHVFLILHWPEDGETFLSIEGNWGGQVCINERRKNEISAVSRWI